MNKVILMGRVTRDIEVRYTTGEPPMAIARYTLAVPRKFKREGEADADFIGCVAFKRQAEHAEKYYHQGTKIVITGRIQTGSYTNKDGVKVYTTEVVIEEQEFAESKASSEANSTRDTHSTKNNEAQQKNSQTYKQQSMTDENGFMNIPDGVDEELPFQ